MFTVHYLFFSFFILILLQVILFIFMNLNIQIKHAYLKYKTIYVQTQVSPMFY